MKKVGYRSEFAAATEAVASTGGQYMPPVMGVTAFLISEFTGISYFYICIAGLMPVFLYYIAVYGQIHLEAVKLGLRGMAPEEVPSLRGALSNGWPIILPIGILFYFLSRGYGLAMCALYALILTFIIAFFKKKTRPNPFSLLVAFEEGAKMTASIGGALTSAGIIIGTFWVSGLGDELSNAIVTFSGGNLLIALLATSIVCLILGMAVPTPIIYITVYMSTIPALIKMGVHLLGAHFFCFYYAVISGITPPVCLTAFAGAAIAGANPMRTGFTATRLGIAAYLVPFAFVYAPALLTEGSITEMLWHFTSSAFGVLGVAIAFEGQLFRRTNFIERLLFLTGGVMLIMPAAFIKAIGIIIIVSGLILHLVRGDIITLKV